MRRYGRVGLVCGLGLGALLARPLWPQATTDSSVVRGRDVTAAQRLFGRLMSPFCPGLTLADCPSPGADSLRSDIQARLARGESARDITAALVADWGEGMLGAPPVRDWGVLLWALPGVALLAGGAGLWWWLSGLRRQATAAASVAAGAVEAPPLEPAMRERLERELEAYEESLG